MLEQKREMGMSRIIPTPGGTGEYPKPLIGYSVPFGPPFGQCKLFFRVKFMWELLIEINSEKIDQIIVSADCEEST